MDEDIRQTPLFAEAEALYRAFREPGSGRPHALAELAPAAAGDALYAIGAFTDDLAHAPVGRLCRVDLATGALTLLGAGPGSDRQPAPRPASDAVAFLADRGAPGDFQPWLWEPAGGARPLPALPGWAEYLAWSPGGGRLLAGVAPHGADVAGAAGAVTSDARGDARPAWMPTVDTGAGAGPRRLHVHDADGGGFAALGPADLNIWEACWCGDDAIAAIASPGASEGDWYDARLYLLRPGSDAAHCLFTPSDQIGGPAASPSGRHVALIEAVCSDRGIVAGELVVVDAASGAERRPATGGVDITHIVWRDDDRLIVAGHRGFEMVVGACDLGAASFTELWASDVLGGGASYPAAVPIPGGEAVALATEGFDRAPEIGLIEAGAYRTLFACTPRDPAGLDALAAAEQRRWQGPGGLAIEGWLLRPHGAGPYPLVMNVHGGPVGLARPVWAGRASIVALMLLRRGYAIFYPNPRGSAGRGRAFARAVVGDIGGADAADLLAGLDALTLCGIADPARLGVMGTSYGGFMTSWLIGQDPRFAAAVPIAPHTNQVTEYLLSNIPRFVALFVGDRFDDPAGRHYSRSPLLHAAKVTTPTLAICGARDRCTPPVEAEQFHRALVAAATTSALVTYPEEGHGIRALPAAIDCAARVVGWFETHIGGGA